MDNIKEAKFHSPEWRFLPHADTDDLHSGLGGNALGVSLWCECSSEHCLPK